MTKALKILAVAVVFFVASCVYSWTWASIFIWQHRDDLCWRTYIPVECLKDLHDE